MIVGDGQLEAFEENIFLHSLLLSSKNSWLNAEFYAAFRYSESWKKIFFKATNGSR